MKSSHISSTFILFLMLGTASTVFAQGFNPNEVVEHHPEPTVGHVAFYQYIHQNIYQTPEAHKSGVHGKVFVEFVVDEDGSLNDITVVRGLGNGLDEIAVDLIRHSPEWKPGTQKGKAVAVKMTLPIYFSKKLPIHAVTAGR